MSKYVYRFQLRPRGDSSDLKVGLLQLAPNRRGLCWVAPFRFDGINATYELEDGCYLLVKDESSSDGTIWAWYIIQVREGMVDFLDRKLDRKEENL
jgi:hypothetical protein